MNSVPITITLSFNRIQTYKHPSTLPLQGDKSDTLVQYKLFEECYREMIDLPLLLPQTFALLCLIQRLQDCRRPSPNDAFATIQTTN